MSIFKKKSKAEKAEKAAEKKASKKNGKEGKTPTEEPKAAEQPYKHVPKHAGADAAKEKSAHRLSKGASDYVQGQASFQHRPKRRCFKRGRKVHGRSKGVLRRAQTVSVAREHGGWQWSDVRVPPLPRVLAMSVSEGA